VLHGQRPRRLGGHELSQGEDDKASDEAQKAYDAFEKDVVEPLRAQRRFDELCERLEERLGRESDAEVRKRIIFSLANFRGIEGRAEESLAWAIRGTEERPGDPSVWETLTNAYLFRGPSWPPPAYDLADALRCSEQAVAVALETDTWVRNVLFTRGRIANAAARWDIIEEVMRALIEDAPKSRELDIPMIETDYLDGLPPGAVDPELRARFFVAMRKAVRIRPPMRDDPDEAAR